MYAARLSDVLRQSRIRLRSKDLKAYGLNIFFTIHYLAPLIISALATGLMRRLGFQAIWTDTWSDGLKKIMRTAFPATRFGMSPFGIRHELVSPSFMKGFCSLTDRCTLSLIHLFHEIQQYGQARVAFITAA
jgi:hypothetical protein